jgi:allantoicase
VSAEHGTAAFTALADLASARVGGRAIAASDDFFAAKSNLVKSEPPVFLPGKYTSRGKWMDGWESRRRRTPGHDWCVVRLGLRGVIRGVNVATQFFTGNFPTHCSIEACDVGGAATERRALSGAVSWVEILPTRALRGDRDNLFALADERPWTHLRLNIYPDGGVARLRVHGEAAIDWTAIARRGRTVDLASIANGGLALGANDMHYGAPGNLIMPGRGVNMGDGWETRRRRGPGHDWAIVRLGATGIVERVEIDTHHFKGNYPDRASLDGVLAAGATLEALASARWQTLLPETTLHAHRRHVITRGLQAIGPVSHVRLNIHPDGGVSRLRVHGRVHPA